MGPTLIIVKSEHSIIFGGFTDIDWTSIEGVKSGNGNSFLHSLRDNSRFEIIRCLPKNNEVIREIDW